MPVAWTTSSDTGIRFHGADSKSGEVSRGAERPLITFAGGGTGGHLFPALAVIEHLREQGAPVDAEFLCTGKPIDQAALSAWNVPHTRQPVLPLQIRLWKLPRFYLAWRESVRQCTDCFRQRRPSVVVGTGGYGSGPAVVAAARMSIPAALFNPDALPGRANRHLASRTGDVFVQWPATHRYFDGHHGVHVWGCPVRAAFRRPPQEPHALLGLDPGRRTLLITGASLGSHSINEALQLLAGELAAVPNWQILHICGARDEAAVRNAYQTVGARAVVCAFTEHMAAALVCADLVVGRAGAVTLAELSAVGRACILLPYPHHADQHQRCNAQILADLGAAVVLTDVDEARANARQLRQVLLPLMNDHRRRAAMADAARVASPPDASARIAERLLQIAGVGAAVRSD